MMTPVVSAVQLGILGREYFRAGYRLYSDGSDVQLARGRVVCAVVPDKPAPHGKRRIRGYRIAEWGTIEHIRLACKADAARN